LARLGAQRGCKEVLEGCVKASGGAVSEEALSQTTLRALLEAAPFLGGAFAPRAEAAAALLSADASALDTLSDAQIGALALATCDCLDRGTYSRAGTDEQKRRGAAARAVLKALVVDSTERSKVVISALRGCVERCGTARPDESSASEDEAFSQSWNSTDAVLSSFFFFLLHCFHFFFGFFCFLCSSLYNLFYLLIHFLGFCLLC